MDDSTSRRGEPPEDLCIQAIKFARMVQNLPNSRFYAIIVHKYRHRWTYGVITGGKVQAVGPRSSMEQTIID